MRWNDCLNGCVYMCCTSLYICMCSLYICDLCSLHPVYTCIQLYSAKGINDVAPNQKYSLFVDCLCLIAIITTEYTVANTLPFLLIWLAWKHNVSSKVYLYILIFWCGGEESYPLFIFIWDRVLHLSMASEHCISGLVINCNYCCWIWQSTLRISGNELWATFT